MASDLPMHHLNKDGKQRDVVAAEDLAIGTSSFGDAGLTKRFDLFSTIGSLYSLTCVPLAVGTYTSFTVGVGGPPVYFWSFLLATIMNMCICFSLAEISAIYPHVSGQIFWTAVMAPKRSSRFLSYLTGWYASAGWFFWTCGTFLIAAQLILALVSVYHETFTALSWHYYLVYLCCGLTSVAFNIPLFRFYPTVLKFMIVLINTSALFLMISLLVRAHPKQSASAVFVDIINETGWTSNGVVFCIGLLPGVTPVNAFDAPAHMTEELPNPARQVPQVMIGSSIMSALVGLLMVIVYLFCIVAPDNLLDPVGGQPVVQLMLDAYHSLPLTTIGTLLFIINFVMCATSLHTTASRVWWSFTREGGAIFPHFFGRVNRHYNLPVNSILFIFFASALIGLVELGSLTALNAILGAAILCIFASYAFPILLMLRQRKHMSRAGHRYCNLGSVMGPVLNIAALLWIAFMFAWLCFPLYLPVSAATMNYAAVVFVGITVLIVVNWYGYSKRAFTGLARVAA